MHLIPREIKLMNKEIRDKLMLKSQLTKNVDL
jgi:hypothetical protein